MFWIIVAVLFCVIFYFVFNAFYKDAIGEEKQDSKLSRFQRIRNIPMELVMWISFAVIAVILAVAKWADLVPSQI